MKYWYSLSKAAYCCNDVLLTEKIHKFIVDQLQRSKRVPLCLNPNSLAYKTFQRLVCHVSVVILIVVQILFLSWCLREGACVHIYTERQPDLCMCTHLYNHNQTCMCTHYTEWQSDLYVYTHCWWQLDLLWHMCTHCCCGVYVYKCICVPIAMGVYIYCCHGVTLHIVAIIYVYRVLLNVYVCTVVHIVTVMCVHAYAYIHLSLCICTIVAVVYTLLLWCIHTLLLWCMCAQYCCVYIHTNCCCDVCVHRCTLLP